MVALFFPPHFLFYPLSVDTFWGLQLAIMSRCALLRSRSTTKGLLSSVSPKACGYSVSCSSLLFCVGTQLFPHDMPAPCSHIHLTNFDIFLKIQIFLRGSLLGLASLVSAVKPIPRSWSWAAALHYHPSKCAKEESKCFSLHRRKGTV